jgi:hypothetical protein
LDRPRNIEGAANLEKLAVVIERMHAIRVEIESRIDVADESVLREAIPKACHDIVKFACATIPRVVIQMIVSPKIERGVRIGCRHDVPARAAAADVIERRETARDMIGLVESRRRGSDKSDVFGGAGEGRKQGEGLE